MMTPKERMRATLEFASPDRLPVIYHPSTAGLHVHGQALLDLFHQYLPDNPITFPDIPHPHPDTLAPDGTYYEELTDAWGVRWGYHIFGIQGQPVAYPFASWQEGVESYHFPPLPAVGSQTFREYHQFSDELKANHFLIDGWVSAFQQLYALHPMEEVLVDLALGEPALIAFLDRLMRYNEHCVDFILAKGADGVMFGDDWASQTAPLVSPSIFRDLFKPYYQRVFARVHAAGARVFFHCCGWMDYLLDELLELGMDGLWHQSAMYDSDAFAQRCRDAGVTVYLHPDRQRLIPHGTPAEIRATIARFAERYHRLGGGAIFYVEIENDAPLENVTALIEAIDQYR